MFNQSRWKSGNTGLVSKVVLASVLLPLFFVVGHLFEFARSDPTD
jgi:heme/copper-type cytochrome/quinol oxidase subunit 3